jgi:ubiquinone/menaquinone biosynthesis C-methylase UbiE
MTDPKQSYIDSHKDYYASVEGPIGGDDRFRWVASEFLSSMRGQKVLEIGCGEGSLLQMISAGNEVHGIDISDSGVEKTRAKGIPCHLADASNEPLPYPDGFFDVAITLETIEHVENPHRMLWEIKRVVKEGGLLLISIPGEKVYHPFIYPGLFTQKNFREFLESSGFEVLKLSGWGQAPLLAHWRRRTMAGDNSLAKKFADLVFYAGRKRNLLFRKKLGTPLYWAYTLNFLCRNKKKDLSRIEEVARETHPDVRK